MEWCKDNGGSPADRKTDLFRLYDSVADGCVECGLCLKDCRYLQRYGTPRAIAVQGSLEAEMLRTAFECSLCGLCTAVCPKEIDPAAMFEAMRRVAESAGHGTFHRHGSLLRYERWGMSPAFSWYGLPEGCETVFFPGCAVAGSRSKRVVELFSHIRRDIPSLGIVLDCCAKPSHDLGRLKYFSQMFGALRDTLAARGVKRVLVTCPSCYRVWKDYGGTISVESVYELLARTGPLHRVVTERAVTVHDPCPTRYEQPVQEAIRKLVEAMGISLREMKHRGRKTLCCGEGGAACYLAPDFAGNWTATRTKEAEGSWMVTYCAGCTNFLGRLSSVGHVIDLFFEPEKTLEGRVRVARSPLTWIMRLLLKRKLRKLVRAKVSGARDPGGWFEAE